MHQQASVAQNGDERQLERRLSFPFPAMHSARPGPATSCEDTLWPAAVGGSCQDLCRKVCQLLGAQCAHCCDC
jgi:hypothetical protein